MRHQSSQNDCGELRTHLGFPFAQCQDRRPGWCPTFAPCLSALTWERSDDTHALRTPALLHQGSRRGQDCVVVAARDGGGSPTLAPNPRRERGAPSADADSRASWRKPPPSAKTGRKGGATPREVMSGGGWASPPAPNPRRGYERERVSQPPGRKQSGLEFSSSPGTLEIPLTEPRDDLSIVENCCRLRHLFVNHDPGRPSADQQPRPLEESPNQHEALLAGRSRFHRAGNLQVRWRWLDPFLSSVHERDRLGELSRNALSDIPTKNGGPC